MFEQVVVATDGSESVKRGVQAAVDLTARFDGTVHALYVADPTTTDGTGDDEVVGDDAIEYVRQQTTGADLVTAVRAGDPATEIIDYAETIDADAIAMGTRGRDGEHAFLLGSVAEAVVRQAPMPVLTVRQLDETATAEQ